MRLFRRKATRTAPTTASGAPRITELGILFDIAALGGGRYARTAYRILFESLDPQRLAGCSLYDGDTDATLAGRANVYCIALRSSDPRTSAYVRQALGTRTDEGLLPAGERFLQGDVTAREPLVHAGEVDEDGCLVVGWDGMVRPEWAEGTEWHVVSR